MPLDNRGRFASVGIMGRGALAAATASSLAHEAAKDAPRKTLPHTNKPVKPKNNKAHRKQLKKARQRERRMHAGVCMGCGKDHTLD